MVVPQSKGKEKQKPCEQATKQGPVEKDEGETNQYQDGDAHEMERGGS